MLGGDGTVNADVSNTGGTVAPGHLARHADDQRRLHPGRRRDAPRRDRRHRRAQHDLLDVTGTATLDGTLQLVTAPGFDPAPAATFRVLDAATRTGTFATVSGTQATPQKSYLVSYDATGVTLAIGLGPANTARPSIPASGEPGDTITCQPGHVDAALPRSRTAGCATGRRSRPGRRTR